MEVFHGLRIQKQGESNRQNDGPYRPCKRRLWTDYHDDAGEDFNEEVTVWHNPEAGDDVLLADIQQKLSQRGYKLTALWEMPETAPGGELKLLRMDRQWLEGQLNR